MATCPIVCVCEGVCEVNQPVRLSGGFPFLINGRRLFIASQDPVCLSPHSVLIAAHRRQLNPTLSGAQDGHSVDMQCTYTSDWVYDLSQELERDAGVLLSVYKPLGPLQQWGAGETEEGE